MWIGVDFAAAILFLVGAVPFYLGAALMLGQLDLADLQARFRLITLTMVIVVLLLGGGGCARGSL